MRSGPRRCRRAGRRPGALETSRADGWAVLSTPADRLSVGRGDRALVLVGGSGAQLGGVAAGFLAEHSIELGVAAEPGLVGRGERGRAPTIAVETHETLESLLVAKPTDREAHLGVEQSAQVRGAQRDGARQVVQVAGVRVGVQKTRDSVDPGMNIDASDDVVAVEKRAPGAEQQVGQPDVEQGVIERLGLAQLTEEGTQAPDQVRLEAARVPTDRIPLE